MVKAFYAVSGRRLERKEKILASGTPTSSPDGIIMASGSVVGNTHYIGVYGLMKNRGLVIFTVIILILMAISAVVVGVEDTAFIGGVIFWLAVLAICWIIALNRTKREGVSKTGSSLDTRTGTKVCPYCAEAIKAGAIKCKHCGSMLDGNG